MSVPKYIEIDSSYRNRNMYPNPSQFSIELENRASTQETAADPVTNAYPEYVFSPNNFNLSGIGGYSVTVKYNFPTTTDGEEIKDTSSNYNFVVYEKEPNTVHREKNYYTGCVLVAKDGIDSNASRRIISWEFLNVKVEEEEGLAHFLVAVEAPFQTFAENIEFDIINPTDFIDSNFPLIFIPESYPIANWYNKYRLYNQTERTSMTIESFDKITHIAKLTGPLNAGWGKDDIFCLRLEDPVIKQTTLAFEIAAGSTTTVINFNSDIPSYFVSGFIRLNDPALVEKGQIRRIVSTRRFDPITGTYDNKIMTVSPPLSAAPAAGDPFEILQYTRDNYVSLSYSGSTVSQQQSVAYEIQLINLSLPNVLLKTGGQTAYYNYVYVELQNTSSTGNNLKNIIYSNNPNSRTAMFRATITDINDPVTSPFVNVDGDSMRQVVAFKPNDGMQLVIRLPNGEILTSVKEDTSNGQPPNPFVQVSALFQIVRI